MPVPKRGGLLYSVLSRLAGGPLADAMLGDLHEVRERRRRQASAPLAALWFWSAASGLILHALGVRLREAAGALAASRGGTRGASGDLHYTLRGLRRNPGFAAGAILLLALGIGANTAVFSVLHSVVLRPLPYVEPDRLMYVWGGDDVRPASYAAATATVLVAALLACLRPAWRTVRLQPMTALKNE